MKKIMMGNGDWRLKYRGITFKRFYCLLSIIFLFFSACGGPLNSPPRQKTFPAGKGSITLVVDGADSRTISPDPDKVTFAAYTILFYESGTVNLLETENRTSANLSDLFYLVPGTYDIKVTAYIDSDRTKAAAQGSLYNIEIKTGVNAAHNITLNPITTVNSTGTFRWEITVPSGLISASMTITPVDPTTGTEVETIPLTTQTFTSFRTLKTGYYRILIKLKKTDNEQEIIFREFLHVYDNLESSFSREFTNDHFNNIKYTVTFIFDNGANPASESANCFHGETIPSRTPNPNKPTPVGLYLGAPPESQTLTGWNDESGVLWNFDNPVTSDMKLTAQWTAPGLVPYASVPKNNVDAAVTYINAHKDTYTLLMDGNAAVSSAIALSSNTSLTIRGLSSMRTITLSDTHILAVENAASLTVGNNITFAGSDTLFIDSGASLTLSGNAVVSILNLFATNTGNSSVTIDSGWTGAVASLNLRGNDANINTVIGLWYKKDSPVTVLKGGGLNSATVEKFSLGNFNSLGGLTKSITAANPPDAPGGYKISTDAGDIGKLVAINYAARVVAGMNAGDYPTLNEAITKADNGSATIPTEIVILRDINAFEDIWTLANNVFYNIPSGKHIKLTVEAGKEITITLPTGDFALFCSNSGSSLTLDGGGGKITLDGKQETSAENRHGVYVNDGTFIMNNDVTITGFYTRSYGGGVYVKSGTFTMNDGTITYNKSDGSGGGVYCGLWTTFNMNRGTISYNTATEGDGGGGVRISRGAFTMSGGAIKNNTAISGSGGGVYVYGGFSASVTEGAFTMIGGEIMNNTANFGGGVYTNEAIFTMSGGTIYGVDDTHDPSWTNIANSATTPNGAALYSYLGTANYSGGYGTGAITTTNDTLPPPKSPFTIVKTLSTGSLSTFAIKEESLYAWGVNSDGNLGNGTMTNLITPTRIGSDTNWEFVSAGSQHTVAIKSDGSLWAWGNNYYGQLGNGNTSTSMTPIRIGSDSNWVFVSASYNHTVAIKADGSLWAWGDNYYGQLGDGTNTSKNTPTRIGTDAWSLVSAGDRYTVAIKTDGSLWAWGYNNYGQLGNGNTSTSTSPIRIGSDSNWVFVSAGSDRTVAIKDDGSLWAWGYNGSGQLGDGSTSNSTTPIPIGSASNWVSVSVGSNHTVAIKADGSLWAWGRNNYGQLGDGTTTTRTTPIQIGDGTDWMLVSAGGEQTFAAKTDGSIWGWGHNTANDWLNGLLGTGDTTTPYYSSPTLIMP